MKVLAYTAIAAILGVLVMLAPFFTVPTPTSPAAGNTYAPLSPQRALEGLDMKTAASESAVGVVPNYPVDAISVCLMLLFSLAFAFAVSFSLKRKHFAPRTTICS